MNRQLPDEPSDQEPEVGEETGRSIVPKPRQSLSRVRRELSEDEFASPAAQRLLLEEIERLERERTEMLAYRDMFHKMDKKAEALEARLQQRVTIEILHGVCLAVGAALMGYAPNVWKYEPAGWLALVFGMILIVGGVVAKAVHR